MVFSYVVTGVDSCCKCLWDAHLNTHVVGNSTQITESTHKGLGGNKAIKQFKKFMYVQILSSISVGCIKMLNGLLMDPMLDLAHVYAQNCGLPLMTTLMCQNYEQLKSAKIMEQWLQKYGCSWQLLLWMHFYAVTRPYLK